MLYHWLFNHMTELFQDKANVMLGYQGVLVVHYS